MPLDRYSGMEENTLINFYGLSGKALNVMLLKYLDGEYWELLETL